MMRAIIGFSALLCLVPLVTQAQEQKNEPQVGDICGAKMVGAFEGCCNDVPKVLKNETFVQCVNQLYPRVAARLGRLKHKKGKSVTSAPKTKRDVADTTEKKKTKHGAKKTRKGARGSPLRIMTCVLREQKLLTASGEPNFPALEKGYIAAAKDKRLWTPIIQKAVLNCSSEYEKARSKLQELNAVAPPKGQLQSKGAQETKERPNEALAMTCMRQYLAANCPKPSIKQESGCADKIELLQTCNPFKLKASYKAKLMGNRAGSDKGLGGGTTAAGKGRAAPEGAKGLQKSGGSGNPAGGVQKQRATPKPKPNQG